MATKWLLILLILAAVTAFSESRGSTFVHWGSRTCPGGTTIQYSGISGSTFQTAGDAMCLTLDQVSDDFYSLIFDEVDGGYANEELPCAVCKMAQADTFLFDGLRFDSCPVGWKLLYQGQMVQENFGLEGGVHLCMDGAYQATTTTETAKFTYQSILTKCTSISCSPDQYEDCFVCSEE